MWLHRTIDAMRQCLRTVLKRSIDEYLSYNTPGHQRDEFILDFPAQVAITACQTYWCTEVEECFVKVGNGQADALETYIHFQHEQLLALITRVRTKLTKTERCKVMCVITLDSHAKTMVQNMVAENVTRRDAFGWQCQLKYRWDLDKNSSMINICDAEFEYSYEYLGNMPRLVITPLTDRIYITATQALHLVLGCAPAGPAGTGKTETTKDLSSQCGVACYVFNCSDQMDYRSMADIFKGLASSGSWGCFDEFNRISPEVLSVCSVQVKIVLPATPTC
jgi:dynein heavy chain